ncbi:MAG: NAD+ synthase [Sulfolobales archaeon]
MDILKHLLDLDWEGVVDEIIGFVKSYVERSGASGVVVGLSGGVDSSVTLSLLVRALGSERVLGLIMPTSFTPKQDVEDAIWLAERLGIKYKIINIDGIVEEYKRSADVQENPSTRIALANLRARVRMTLLYLHANLGNLLVAGTSDKSEILLGYYTKYGDGASDFLLISHLYKTQVRELGRRLGLPERIYAKPSSPQLYPGHRARDELPADYEIIDQVFYLVFDKGYKLAEASKTLGIDPHIVASIIKRYLATEHKRSLPPSPKPYTILIDRRSLEYEVRTILNHV